jgi:hypothetical protein
MKITSIYLKDFLGIEMIGVPTPQPVQLFAGGNMAGKSTIRDAVALAITGQLSRVALKKEAGELVRTGANGADCEVHCGEEVYSFGISAAGKLSQPKNLKPEFAYVLEAQRFAHLPEDERRKYLFELMRVKMTIGDIVTELLQLGHDKDRVATVQPLLRAGFDPAAKDAKERATASKGAWKQITSETWGSEKGKDWTAPVPVANPEKLQQLATEQKHADAALASWNEQKGKIKADVDYRAQRQAQLPALREKAALEQRIRDKLATDEAELARLKPLLEHAAGSAGGAVRIGIQHDLAKALQPLIKIMEQFDLEDAEKPALQHAQLTLANYEAQFGRLGGSGDPEAVGRAQKYREAVTTCESAIAHDKRDLTAALEAKAQIIHIEAELAQPFDADALKECDSQITEITAKRTETLAALEREKNLKLAADQAEDKTKKAAAAHAEVLAWDALGDTLSPDGLPATLLARALGPLNERLLQSCGDTSWPQVVVHSDMRITAADRDYRLLSVSERWRVDAMIAEAISCLSGMRLLVLDGFDVLQPSARGDLIGWLDVLVEQNELDTALLFGTLKEPPKGMPESVGVHWIQNGRVTGELLKEAA